MPSYRYYLGPLVWADGAWSAPAGTAGMVDLGTLDDCGQSSGAQRPVAFLASTVPLDSAWTLLGTGDCREIAATGAMRDAFRSLLGYRPDGERLVDLLWDHLTNGSDPDGGQSCPPLVPTSRGALELWLPGHSMVKAERFAWGKHSHTAKLKKLLHKQLLEVRKATKKGKYTPAGSSGPDHEYHRRFLQRLVEKYHLGTDWKELKPSGWGNDETPLPHGSSVSDNFNRADETLTGNWTNVLNTLVVYSNVVRGGASGAYSSARYETALSSDDHYAQVDNVYNSGYSISGVEPAIRFDPSANTMYTGGFFDQSNLVRIYKVVDGTRTTLSSTALTASVPQTSRLEASGSSLKVTVGGSEIATITDTSITGNVRAGLYNCASTSARDRSDNFIAEDLATTITVTPDAGSATWTGTAGTAQKRVSPAAGAAAWTGAAPRSVKTVNARARYTVTGTLSPDATGVYTETGETNYGQPVYSNGTYTLAVESVSFPDPGLRWCLFVPGMMFPPTTGYWHSTSLTGDYTPVAPCTGTAHVTGPDHAVQWAGAAATARKTQRAAAGATAWSGASPTTRKTQRPSAVELIWAGLAATVRKRQLAAADVGAMAWTGTAVIVPEIAPLVPGAEFTLPAARPHYTLPAAVAEFVQPAARPQFTQPDSLPEFAQPAARPHFTLPEED